MLENDLGATFKGLVAEMTTNVKEWSNLFTTDVPYSDDLPGEVRGLVYITSQLTTHPLAHPPLNHPYAS